MTRVTDIPPGFRHVRLVLAREKGSPKGRSETGYDLLAPLSDDGRLDAAAWRVHRRLCRVRRFGPNDEMIGRLGRKPGGAWYFDYAAGSDDDETGFRFDDERFVTGEYVSLQHAGVSHTYRVARVEKP